MDIDVTTLLNEDEQEQFRNMVRDLVLNADYQVTDFVQVLFERLYPEAAERMKNRDYAYAEYQTEEDPDDLLWNRVFVALVHTIVVLGKPMRSYMEN